MDVSFDYFTGFIISNKFLKSKKILSKSLELDHVSWFSSFYLRYYPTGMTILLNISVKLNEGGTLLFVTK